MKRQLAALEQRVFDVVIIGGGITGATLAFDAATRGLDTALVDKGDFGAATSAASSKLLHGGLRYLQQLRFGKVRESALERIYFQNLAPHLTHYVPFVVPTYRGLAKGKALLAGGMLAYETLCLGQNRLVRDPGKQVPSGRGLATAEVRELIPGIAADGLTGGRLFYESHMHSSERMTLAFVNGAARHDAVVANYVRVDDFVIEDERVTGIRVTDLVGGRELRVRARMVINAAGPWIRQLNERVQERPVAGVVTGFSKGAHIVTRPLTRGHAVALPTRRKNQSVIDRGGRHVFVIPWRERSLIGTTYGPYEGPLDAVAPTSADVQELLDDINAALDGANLEQADVEHAFAGLYPLIDAEIDPEVYQGTGDYQVLDHEAVDALPGLFSVFGAKYTTARQLAERALDRIVAKIERPTRPCATRELALPAGDIEDLGRFRRERHEAYDGQLGVRAVDHLVTNYGTDIDGVAELVSAAPELAHPLASDRETLAAEAVWAVRYEMAQHLEDFLYRRTGLATIGLPAPSTIERAAQLMGEELGWDAVRQGDEIARVAPGFAA